VTQRGDFSFRRIQSGIERFPGYSLPRHRHLEPYATVVLDGSFVEAGYAGRIRAKAGDVLIHPALDCHENRLVSSHVTLIRLAWKDTSGAGAFYRLDNLDDLARTAQRDPKEAALVLASALRSAAATSSEKVNDWPDLLAGAMTSDSSLRLRDWAVENGLAAETISRGFRAAFGISPVEFRAELRARSAWLRITRDSQALSDVAAELGFADQAHMTRWVHRVSGASPVAWRRRAEWINGRLRIRANT
jgi:AraC-like DNA-binding protein